ncbi:MAG: hypothetical protein U9Q67_04770 [Patescibacteria group bacterium]|nr:hypothetical protein [Patescibacteria group bacterium]
MFRVYDAVKFVVNILLALVYLDQFAHHGWITPTPGVPPMAIFFTVAIVSRVIELVIDKVAMMVGAEEGSASPVLLLVSVLHGIGYLYVFSILGFYSVNGLVLGIMGSLIYGLLRLPINPGERQGPPHDRFMRPWQ